MKVINRDLSSPRVFLRVAMFSLAMTFLQGGSVKAAILVDGDGDTYYLPVAPSVVSALRGKVAGLQKSLKDARKIVNANVRRAKFRKINAALRIAEGDLKDASLANARPDCNDAAFDINPGASELAAPDDENCNGVINEGFTDLDQDTYFAEIDDCDDSDPNTNPGAVEVLDGKDNNCNGQIDENAVGGTNG